MKEIKGIEKVVEESQNLRGYESGFYLQLNYNQETGEVWTDEIVDYSHNSYVRYDNPNIIGCADLCMPVTAERVRELVADIEK